MAVVSIGPLNPVSGSVAPGKAKVTAVTGWGMLRDGLLSLFLTYGAQKYLCACVWQSEREEWVLSTGAANLQPTTNINTVTPGIFSKDVACAKLDIKSSTFLCILMHSNIWNWIGEVKAALIVLY